RRRVAAGVVSDRPVAPREELHLRPPRPVITGELVHEDERRPLASLFVVQLDAVDRRVGHGYSFQGKLASRISKVFFPLGSWAMALVMACRSTRLRRSSSAASLSYPARVIGVRWTAMELLRYHDD